MEQIRQLLKPTEFVGLELQGIVEWDAMTAALRDIILHCSTHSNTFDQSLGLNCISDNETERNGFLGLVSQGWLRCCNEGMFSDVNGDYPFKFFIGAPLLRKLIAHKEAQ